MNAQYFTPLILIAMVCALALARALLDIARYKEKLRLVFVAVALTGIAVSSATYGLNLLFENWLAHYVATQSFISALTSVLLGLGVASCRIITTLLTVLCLGCLILSIVSSRAELKKWF